jgi:hypothetical protein
MRVRLVDFGEIDSGADLDDLAGGDGEELGGEDGLMIEEERGLGEGVIEEKELGSVVVEGGWAEGVWAGIPEEILAGIEGEADFGEDPDGVSDWGFWVERGAEEGAAEGSGGGEWRERSTGEREGSTWGVEEGN